jgi:L-ascorbate 6-phosphate lactonase
MSSTSPLAANLASLVVKSGMVAVAWICQAGFVLKSPGGKIIAIDPYLSNSCKALGDDAGFNMDRLVPPPLQPRELTAFDALLFSHSHQDHVDPETIKPYLAAGGNVAIIAPHDAAELLKKLGVKGDRITMTWANQTHRVGDFGIRTAFAIPPDGGDLTHVGYIIEVEGGPRLYFTCDTDYNDVLPLSVGPYAPDVLLTVINPAFRNLTPRDAAKLAKELNPKWVVPCHHDLFPDNSLSERLLRTNLKLVGMEEAYCPLKQGEVHIFDLPKDRKRPSEPLV